MTTESSRLPTALDYLRNTLDLTEVSLQASRPGRKRSGPHRIVNVFFSSAASQEADNPYRRVLEELGASLSLPVQEDKFPTVNQVEDWFKGLDAEAKSAGNPAPAQNVVEEAKRIVLGLRPLLPLDSDVHTWDDGEVAIEVFGVLGHGFLLLCEPDGSALCVVTVDNVSRRARYESSADLPDGFLREGLQEVLSVA